MRNNTNKKGWTIYEDSNAFPYSKCFYQKPIRKDPNNPEERIYANIVEFDAYTMPNGAKIPKSWQLELQLDDSFSIVGKCINIKAFTYLKLDFDQMENDALLIVNALI